MQQLRREMQASSGRGHGAIPVGVNGLIVSAILVIFASLGGDIRRQRHRADFGDGSIQHRPRHIELEGDDALVALVGDCGVQFVQQTHAVGANAKAEAVALLQTLPGLRQRAP